MGSDDTTAYGRAERLLKRLGKGLERRPAVEGAARVEMDRELCRALDELAELVHSAAIPGPPTRAAATAMALAMFSQPHLEGLLAERAIDGTGEDLPPPSPPVARPFVAPPEILAEVLGLPLWELEDLREEVDRRVGLGLKQARAVTWLWNHYGLPGASADGLFRVLFPAAPSRVARIGLVRHGTQLYAVTDQELEPPIEALWLPWSAVDEHRAFHPLRTFRGKYVNANLRRSLGRAIGANEGEAIELLDRMVAMLPRTSLRGFLAADAWRARGFGQVTDLPGPHGANGWMSRTLDPEELQIQPWMRVRDGALTFEDANTLFDKLALPRANEVVRHLVAAILARQCANAAHAAFEPGDLPLFDVTRHFRAALTPLVAWAKSPKTRAGLAAQLGLERAAVDVGLDGLAASWTAQLEGVWAGATSEDGTPTVRQLVVCHLVAVADTVRRVLSQPDDGPAHDLVLLYAAHACGANPVDRLLAEAHENVTWPPARFVTGDLVGPWFEPLVSRVLAAVGDEITVPP